MQCYAILIDTVSIQQYIFGSNKLKENLGASYIVSNIYERQLKNALRRVFSHQFNEDDFNRWRNDPDYIAFENGHPFEIAYIGGGNAMLLFKEKAKAEEFVREWTKLLLVEAPGLNTATAIGEFDTKEFDTSKKALFEILTMNKYRYAPLTTIPRHGITAECRRSGLSMDTYYPTEKTYISSVVNAKINAVAEAKQRMQEMFQDVLGDTYCFTDEIGKLGQKVGEDNYIAIVHIDGNSMADRFASQSSLEALRRLSKSVHEATIKSVKEMIRAIKNEKAMLTEFLGVECFNKEGDKEILPFRPIIIGGDDITFVSEGRLGIWLAEQFLKAFEKQTVTDKKPLDASAGVAITKTKYPFYRGYALSKQLCQSAKAKRRAKRRKINSKDSWIDFHITSGGVSGSLEQIRAQYVVSQGNLLMRPYCLNAERVEYDFETLKENLKILAKLPKNKIHEMREVLTLGENHTKMFVKDLEARGDDGKIPEIVDKNYRNSLFENSETPYFDMIELMEFYPGLKEA
ncbi:MAG TPA: hypothetical protein PKW07_10895 [Syntrophorhabdaceae bacterium]|nr:hypothetical protein [Syntrophorhabdaceae bacterium]